MSGTTVLYNGSNPAAFTHHQGLATFVINNTYPKLISIHPNDLNNINNLDINMPHIVPFLSEKTKVFIGLMNGPWHFLHDSLGPAIHLIESYPDAQYIFDISVMHEFDNSYLNYFFSTLYKKNIDFKVVKFEEGQTVVAKDFLFRTNVFRDLDNGNNLFNFFKDCIKDPTVKPFRKIYISRRNMKNRDYTNTMADGPSFKNDNRIDNEPLLEKFLSDIGFEIVIPEDFASFEDQINYFYETKTAVSLTSSGLTSTAFMQPGGNVVEIINTMVVPFGEKKTPSGLDMAEEALHHYYVSLSFNKGHNYFGLPNKTRKAEDVISRIKNNSSLRSVFEF